MKEYPLNFIQALDNSDSEIGDFHIVEILLLLDTSSNINKLNDAIDLVLEIKEFEERLF